MPRCRGRSGKRSRQIERVPEMNEETYRIKNYELELQKQIERSRHWLWQRGVWIAALAVAGTSLVYEIAGRAA